ncbi:OmpA family protein [Pseudonocardia adelaidensis]|uniref:OmpA family protein n=1 Tax=Pseudonocardia adelaidensis TaxID=648754 RepID=UPI0031E86C25
MARAHVWWSVALLVVPAALAGLALLWAGPREQVAPPVAPAHVLPATPAVETRADRPDPTPARVAGVQAAQPILFTADSAELAGPSAGTVQRVAELLVAGPAAPVLVEGHVADTPGGPEAVQQLSDRRAAVVADALVAAGVPAERITARGLGATKPLATVEASRRVEITIG